MNKWKIYWPDWRWALSFPTCIRLWIDRDNKAIVIEVVVPLNKKFSKRQTDLLQESFQRHHDWEFGP